MKIAITSQAKPPQVKRMVAPDGEETLSSNPRGHLHGRTLEISFQGQTHDVRHTTGQKLPPPDQRDPIHRQSLVFIPEYRPATEKIDAVQKNLGSSFLFCGTRRTGEAAKVLSSR